VGKLYQVWENSRKEALHFTQKKTFLASAQNQKEA